MSSAFPCGTPSTMSNSTTSPSSLTPASSARVPPIWPAPISAILLRAISNSLVRGGETARVLPRITAPGKAGAALAGRAPCVRFRDDLVHFGQDILDRHHLAPIQFGD